MNQAYGRSSLSLSVSVSIYEDKRETVVCPKPRRLGLLSGNEPIPPLRWHFCHQSEPNESKAGTDLLDIICPKGGHGAEQSFAQVASSPPFFSGSPPSRVSNPLIQDARFGDNKFSPISPRSIPIPSGLSSSPSSSSRMGSCVRASFGDNPAVRIEGFDCLDRDSRNCSIPTLA